MRYVVAVSGGVDSVVLLAMIADGLLPAEQIVVAHFDHGIRPDSKADADFVGRLAAGYGFSYETERQELGPGASEELARDRRYEFLRAVAKRHDATLVTAHHADDVVETIAINFIRGTGWRGLAVLDSPDVVRPLIAQSKTALLGYANSHRLEWHEDSTNADRHYLRNEVRYRLKALDGEAVQLLGLYRNRQVALKALIHKEAARLIGSEPYKRYLFNAISQDAGRELLRAALVAKTGQGATRPQLDRALIATKTLLPGKRFEINDAATLYFTKTDFVIE